jgi:hypothetical protein
MALIAAFLMTWGLLTPAGAAEYVSLTPLPDFYHSHGLAYTDGFLYHAGGLSGSSGVMGGRKLWHAKVEGAALGAWTAGPDLPESTFSHATVAHGRTLYLVGGQHFRPGLGIGASNVVYYSRLNADGTPGPWAQTTPLPKAAFFLNAALWNGRLYVTGGWNGEGLLPDVYSAPANADGTLGAWRAESPLPEGVYTHAAAAEGTLYVLGGVVNGGSDVRSDVYHASIGADGVLGPWSATSPLPVPLANLGSAIAGGRLYVTGGWTGTEASTATYSAPILPDKSLGEWSAYAHFAPGRHRHATAQGGGRLYVSGGVNGAPLNEVLGVELPAAPPPAAAVPALALFMPPVLNLSSNGKSVTSFLAFRAEQARASDVVEASVAITKVDGAAITPIPAQAKGKGKSGEDEEDEDPVFGFSVFKAKFDRAAVQAAISDGENKLTVTGLLADGRAFEGTGRIWGKEKKPVVAAKRRNEEPALKFADSAAQKPVPREGGEVRAGRSGVRLPDGAHAGVLVSVHEAPPLGDDEKGRRAAAARKLGVEPVGEPVEFGPHGTRFDKPVTLELPYDRARLPSGVKESELAVHYWNAGRGEWEPLESIVDTVARVVRAQTTHFSQYQVLSGGIGTSAVSGFGDVYAFPNPARNGVNPTFHVEATGADSVRVRVYDLTGKRVFERTLTGASPFEGLWDVSGVGSGVYYYHVEASGGGDVKRKTGKLAVIK